MATTTEKTARAYSDLVHVNETGAKGYQEAAEGVQSPQLKSEFTQLSQQRAQFAADLKQHASQFGIQVADDSTVEGAVTDAVAAVHRGWINLKSAITGQDDNAIIGEAETGDATALEAYETALNSQDLPQDAKSLLQKQHGQILEAKNKVTSMKK